MQAITLCIKDTIMEKRRGEVTIADIAHIAGVSTATVSRVLAGSAKVRDETRERVQRIIDDLDYEPNHLARGLTTASTSNVGVVLEDIANPFFVEVALGIESVLRPAGYSVFLTSSAWDLEKEDELVRKLVRNRVDGIILAPIEPYGETVQLLQRREVPFVLVNASSQDPGVSWVNADNFHGGRLAARALVETPSEVLISLFGFPHQTSETRREGFAHGVREYGGRDAFEYRPLEEVYNFDAGYACVPDLIARERVHEVPTGIFALNDDVALGVIAALIDHGIPVPQQVSVVGYDDIPTAKRNQVPLTTVAQPKRQMGELAARSLLSELAEANARPRQYKLLPKLVERRSTLPTAAPGRAGTGTAREQRTAENVEEI
ncbi:MAG: LacI family DNA-binding transcriptional regulator [Spirochaetaceae bacterium]